VGFGKSKFKAEQLAKRYTDKQEKKLNFLFQRFKKPKLVSLYIMKTVTGLNCQDYGFWQK